MPTLSVLLGPLGCASMVPVLYIFGADLAKSLSDLVEQCVHEGLVKASQTPKANIAVVLGSMQRHEAI